MRRPYIAGNWKMNMTPSAGAAFASDLRAAAEAAGADVKMMVAPPFVTIPAVVEALKGSSIIVAAQNMADHTSGAYTGEVAPAMLKDLGVNTVILGHSERRSSYGETDAYINGKVRLAIAEGMDVVLCVGETLAEREGGKLEEVLSAQLSGGLKDVTAEEMSHITIAYEPVWAIGTGVTATADQADEGNGFVRAAIAEAYGADLAETVTVQYGGSMNAKNAEELVSKVNVDGGLIGGASLKAQDFSVIVKAASK